MPARELAAKRYAQGVYALAKSSSTADQWAQDLERIASVMDDEQVKGLLGSTRMPLPAKLELLEQTLSGISPLALNFAKLLTMKGRSDLSGEIFNEYMALANAERGIARGVVTTAVSISDEDRGAIERKLGEITDQQVSVTTNVDPEIIGGLIARVGDTLIDGSVRSRLLNLRRRLAT